MDGEQLAIHVFRPDPWPSAALPLLVFTNGQGQLAEKYEHIFEPLVRNGFVVASIQSIGEVTRRLTQMACTLRWIRLAWPEATNQRLNCDLAFAGHSRGGEASWRLTEQRNNIPWSDINPEGFDFQLKALVGIAPRHEGPGEIALARAVPYMGLVGSVDEDIGPGAVTAYDQISQEESLAAGATHTKAVVWA